MNNQYAVSAVGMASPLGDYKSSTATARTGLSRFTPLEMVVPVEDDEYPVNVSGSKCTYLAGFEGFARLAVLLNIAFDDMLNSSDIKLNSDTVVLIVMPKLSERPLLDDQRMIYLQNPQELLRERLLKMKKSLKECRIEFIEESHSGVFLAVKEAVNILNKSGGKRCVVAAADSLIDLSAQEWLFSTGQLHIPDTNNGSIPGEAAVCFTVESLRSAQEVLAIIGSVSVSDVTEPTVEDIETGKLLSKVMIETISEYPDSAVCEQIINDNNGELIRAKEFGNALVPVVMHDRRLSDVPFDTFASSFGDVGAAAGGVMISNILFLFSTDEFLPENALLCCSSYEGLRTTLSLFSPNTAGL